MIQSSRQVVNQVLNDEGMYCPYCHRDYDLAYMGRAHTGRVQKYSDNETDTIDTFDKYEYLKLQKR